MTADQHTGYHRNRTHCGLPSTFPALFLLLILEGAVPAVRATTGLEADWNKRPMPHSSLTTGGPQAQVHMVAMREVLGDTSVNTARLADLKARIQKCVEEKQRHAEPSRPPRIWPDHTISSRVDTYASANRAISYYMTVLYDVDYSDCSLTEEWGHRARLVSISGSCEIDLKKKTAQGVCGADGHAAAKRPFRRPRPDKAELAVAERDAAHNPSAAAFLAARRNFGAAGPIGSKTILGVRCDVVKTPYGTSCLSRGGAFPSYLATAEPVESSMVLETVSEIAITSYAVEARLDTQVSAAVFTPYLAAGFQIENRKAGP